MIAVKRSLSPNGVMPEEETAASPSPCDDENMVINVEESMEEESPLDLRVVRCDRPHSPHNGRDSGTESDDPDDKMIIISDGPDCKPYKKNLIKR